MSPVPCQWGRSQTHTSRRPDSQLAGWCVLPSHPSEADAIGLEFQANLGFIKEKHTKGTIHKAETMRPKDDRSKKVKMP